MKNGAQFLGRFLLDRRGPTPRILEVRDHLHGVFLLTNEAEALLLCADDLCDRIGDLFTSRERAERALTQVMASMGSRVRFLQAANERDTSIRGAERRKKAEPAKAEPLAAEVPFDLVRQGPPRSDPAFVDLVSAVLDLSLDHTRILQALVTSQMYAKRLFTEGLLAGHEAPAINLIHAQAAASVDYQLLVDAITEMKRASLLEVVQDAIAPGQPEIARFWIVVNPYCVDVLASGTTPIGLVA
jgi:hypothetical protein